GGRYVPLDARAARHASLQLHARAVRRRAYRLRLSSRRAPGRVSAIPRLEAVDEVLERAAAEHLVPGAVAIVTDRRGVLHEAAFGLASTREQRPMRTDTVFRIASMTKPLTAVAVLMLAEEGKLALDDPLARHLPGYA